MAIDPAVLHPLLEKYRFNGAQVFASKLGHIQFNVLFAEELVVTIQNRISETAWFLYASNATNKICYFRMKRGIKECAIIKVKKINETKALSSYLFNRKPLGACLKQISKNLCPVDLSILKRKEIAIAKKSYYATLATPDLLQHNTTLNTIQLHSAFIDEGNRKTAKKMLRRKPAMPFVIWAKNRNTAQFTYQVFYIATRDFKGKPHCSKFKIYLCGLLEDRERNLYCYFHKKKSPKESFLDSYAKSHNPSFTVI